jgi:aspartate kinase
MRIIVQKYGGSSVATSEKLQHVAQKIVATQQRGAAVVAVVSAMGDTTNDLLSLVQDVTPQPDHRELDMLLSAGERIAMSLLSMAVQSQGAEAISLTGPQAGIITDDVHTNARIDQVHPWRIQEELTCGKIVIVAGFQGRSVHGEVTTLGRGGSDTTAVALAAALGAESCEIYSDVDGVYTVDPRIVPTAQQLDEISYEEMQELAQQGARVLHAEAVAFAQQHQVEIVARSTFGGNAGTYIRSAEHLRRAIHPVARVTGVAGRQALAQVEIEGLHAHPQQQAVLSNALTGCEILLRETQTGPDQNRMQLLVSYENLTDPSVLVQQLRLVGSDTLSVTTGFGSVAAVGLGLGDQPVMQQAVQQALQAEGLTPVKCFTTPAAVIGVIPEAHVEAGLTVLHQRFVEVLHPVEQVGLERLSRRLPAGVLFK